MGKKNKKKRNKNRRNKAKKNRIKKTSIFSFNNEFYQKINIKMNITKIIRKIKNESFINKITESRNFKEEHQISLQDNLKTHPWSRWISN